MILIIWSYVKYVLNVYTFFKCNYNYNYENGTAGPRHSNVELGVEI